VLEIERLLYRASRWWTNHERQFLVLAGIPEQFLPDHRELGRVDLT
jgi:hypothetical protein